MNVSFFPSREAKGKAVSTVDIEAVLSDIQRGKWKEQINKLRTADADTAKRIKGKLPAFTASCTTSGGHKSTDAQEHSGLLQIDIDKIGHDAAAELREKLRGDSSIYSAWVSPSGDGLKALLRVPADIALHPASFEAAQSRFLAVHGCAIDSSCKDVARLCFVSSDADLWVNKDAAEIELPTHTPTNNFSAPITPITPYTLHNGAITQQRVRGVGEFTKQRLKLYEKLIGRIHEQVTPHTRNKWLCELVAPIAFYSLAPAVALQFAERFYTENASKFNDPLDQHMNETKALLAGLERQFQANLSPQEKANFESLSADEIAVLRICRELPGRTDGLGESEFFLSADQLAARTDRLSMTCWRTLRGLVASGHIKDIKPGTRRTAGKQSRASVFKYAADAPLEPIAKPAASKFQPRNSWRTAANQLTNNDQSHQCQPDPYPRRASNYLY